MAITHGRGLPGDARDYGEEADRWLRERAVGPVATERMRALFARVERLVGEGKVWSGDLGALGPSHRWPNCTSTTPNEIARFHLAVAAIPDDIAWLTEDDL